jgi:multiple sugar transport system substrate-binding protein
MNMKRFTFSISILILLAMMTACASTGNAPSSTDSKNQEPASTAQAAETETADFKKLGEEPLKLTFYSTSGTFPDVEFNTLIADPIKKKYPNVTIERITPAANTTNEEVLSTHVPDIIYSSSSSHQRIIRTGAYEDLRDLIKRHHFDESRIKPILYDYIKEITSDKGNEIYAIPFNANQHILYYNKDIFDKFGVSYPTEKQLTWDEVLEIAAKLTRTENGVNYIGLSVDNLTGLSKGLGLSYVDRETGNAALDTPEWLRVFELNKRIFEIPGYVTPEYTWNWGRDQYEGSGYRYARDMAGEYDRPA